MRKGPKKGTQKIGLIPFNTKVTVINVTDTAETINGKWGPWAYVKYKNKKGWVFAGYLDFNRDHKL